MKKLITLICLSLALTPNIFAQEKDPATIQDPVVANPEKSAKEVSKSEEIEKAKKVLSAKEALLEARKAKSEKPLSEIKDIKITTIVNVVLSGTNFEVSNETTIKFPNKTLTIINGPFGEIKNAYDGNIAWALTPGGTQVIVGDNALEFANALAGDPFSILNNFDKEDYKITLLENNLFEGQNVTTILCTTSTGHEITVYLDPKTNMIVGKSAQSKSAGVVSVNEEIYSNFQKVEGVEIPMKRLLKRNGLPFAEVEVKEVKINSGVDDKIFVKPE